MNTGTFAEATGGVFNDDDVRGVAAFAARHPWPKRVGRAVPDQRSRRRDEARVLGVCEPLHRILADDRCLITQWRPSRGVLTRCLAASLWNAVVVAALDADAGDWGLFFRDCAHYRDRIVALRMSPEDALEELRRFSLIPHVIATTPRTAREVWSDLTLACARAPQAIVVGTGWRDATVADAVRDFVRHDILELEAFDDAWCVWRAADQWIQWRS